MERVDSLSWGGFSLTLPCFFPSISSVKTNLSPLQYLQILMALDHPLFLISTYDVYHAKPDQQERIVRLLQEARDESRIVLIDSGNYECYWHHNESWDIEKFITTLSMIDGSVSFSFDLPLIQDSTHLISSKTVEMVMDNQAQVKEKTIAPIVHGPTELLPEIISEVARRLYPLIIAVPERELGHGIIQRAQTVKAIRHRLNELGVYFPLHLLGTGNPLSILVYSLCGADSFDGLEWCQTTVNYDNALLYHFQQREFFRNQSPFAAESNLPYGLATLVHNLHFYGTWIKDLQEAISSETAMEFAEKYLPKYFPKELLSH